jgi:hypothetical protein
MSRAFFTRAARYGQKGADQNAAVAAGAKTNYRQVIQRAQADPRSLTQQDVLTLQRSIGNRAAARLMQPMLQAKLQLGSAGDKYEQEADRVAAQVVVGAQTSGAVQRDVEENEMMQSKQMHGPEGGELDSGVQGQLQAARGGGKPLDKGVRRQMEQGFGTDFSGVRVHTGQNADSLNRSLNARAFTTGKDIFFRRGEYQPQTFGGKKLLAHELTHTVQQGGVGLQRALLGDSLVKVQREIDDDRFLIMNFVRKLSFFIDSIDNLEKGLARADSLNLQMPTGIEDDELRSAMQNWVDEFKKVCRVVDNPSALIMERNEEESASIAKRNEYSRYQSKTIRSNEKYKKAKQKRSPMAFYHKSKMKSRGKKAVATLNGASFKDFMDNQTILREGYEQRVEKAAQTIIQPFEDAHQHLDQLLEFDLANVPLSLKRETVQEIYNVSGTGE